MRSRGRYGRRGAAASGVGANSGELPSKTAAKYRLDGEKPSGLDAEYQQVREQHGKAGYGRGREPPAGRDKFLSIDSSVSL